MATLTESAYYTRKYIRIGAVGIVAFLVLRFLFGQLLNYYRATFPPNPLKPNNAFGRLPAISFPESASPSGELTFTLQTIEGAVPEASKSARVFFMPKNRSSLLSLSRTQSFVGKMNFTTTPRQTSDTLYHWIDIRNPLRMIDMDIVSNHFTLQYLFQHDLTLFTEKDIPTAQIAATEVLNFLQSLGITLTDINTGNPQVQYLRLVGNELEPASSQSQADAVQVNFFRLNYDHAPIVNDDPAESYISFILSGSRRTDRRILYAKFHYWPVQIESNGIYKLKSSETAWLEFLDGKAHIASFTPGQNQINITNIYLAYYDSEAPQLFMQPVFVIAGDHNFVAYVPAVAPPWTE